MNSVPKLLIIALTYTLASIFIAWFNLSSFLGLFVLAHNKSKNLPMKKGVMTLVGKVMKYSIVNSELEHIKPSQTLYVLKIKVLKTADRESVKEGRILKTYSKRELSTTLFGEIIKVTIQVHNVRYWVKNLIPIPPKDLSLDSTLYGLTHAVDVVKYAKAHGLKLVALKVKVIVELTSPSADISAAVKNVMDIKAEAKKTIRALVPISQLVPLAKDPAVKFVRPPQKAMPLAKRE